jgi:hypothetical protein
MADGVEGLLPHADAVAPPQPPPGHVPAPLADAAAAPDADAALDDDDNDDGDDDDDGSGEARPMGVGLPPARSVHEAAARGETALLALLVEGEGKDVNEADQWDATPLYYACLCGHLGAAKYLLSR